MDVVQLLFPSNFVLYFTSNNMFHIVFYHTLLYNINITWKGKMIKNVNKKERESDTYLATVSRHHWSQSSSSADEGHSAG